MELEITFKVDDKVTQSEWAAYKGFIESSRTKLASKRYSHNRPVLYPQGKSPIVSFHVVLQTKSQEITLNIRPDNLYLVSYKRIYNNSEQWLVFGRGSGPDFLGFGESYNEMEKAAKQATDSIKLSQWQLATAVNQLAISNASQERAMQLIVVIQMICESIRFTRISDHLAKNYNKDTPPPSWMIALEHGWSNLSDALLRADADPAHFFGLPQPNAMQIRTAEEAAAALGILLFSDARKPKMVLENDTLLLRQGRPMAEVFWVRIDDVAGKDPGQLYGTIAVVDGLSSQHLYDRRSNTPEAISPGTKILLTGPDRAISAFDTFTVQLSLRNKSTTPGRDDQLISDGTIVWNALDTAANVFDKILHADVKGEHGSATVCYAVFDDAVEATISVELVSGGGKDSAEVYGEIAAFYSNFPSGEETLLFGKKKEEHVNVRTGQPIGLAKKTVAVPTNYSLIIRAVLHETSSPGRDIANGVAVFPPLFDGASQKNITGPYGNILVKVTWNPSWRSDNK